MGIRIRRTQGALRTPFLLRALVVLGGLLAAFVPGAAWANCGGQAYTYTHTGTGGTSRNLGANQSLRIQSGTFTANIDGLASTAKICVDSGATFQPGNMNNVSGQIVNYGTINFPSVNFSTGFQLDNFGNTTFTSGANFNGAVNFNNRANANLYFRQTVQFSNSSIFNNDGFVQADYDFNLQSGTNFVNTFDMLVKGTFNPSGSVNNTGRVHALAFININGGSAAKNWCSWIADGGFNNNSNLTENHGLIFINWTSSGQAGNNNLWQNNQTFKIGPDSIVYGWRFANNSTITNMPGPNGGNSLGGGRFFFKMPSGTTPTEHTKNQGPFTGLSSTNKIIFYDETQLVAGRLFDQPNSSNQNYTNAERVYFEPPPINYAAPTCSPAIRQVLTGIYDADGDGEPEPPPPQYDYSDAPSTYGAPFHQIVSGLHLGTVAPDWDGNGNGDWNGDGVVDNLAFNTPNADGDDLAIGDDEDGITSMPTFVKGQQATLNVRVNGAGYLTGWIDYNGNGTFEDTSAERIAYNAQDNGAGTGLALDNTPANDGIIRLIFTPPSNAAATKTYIRLRWSASQSLGPTNPSTSGEVEDYTFTFGIAPEPELPPGGGGGAGGGSTPSSCTAPEMVTLKSGNGLSQTTSGTVANPANALGAIVAQGVYADASNSANLGASGVLTIDLIGGATSNPNNIPASADVTLSLTRVDATSRVLVQVSANNSDWTTIGYYGAGSPALSNDFSDGVLKRVMFEAPAGGIRYVRLTRQAGNFWVDGVSTQDICGIPPSLTIVKSSEGATAGDFMLPGKDVIYNIIVTNSGTLPVDNNAVLLIDALPTQITFINSNFAVGTGPVAFTPNTSSLTLNASDVAFSNLAIHPTAFTQCTYQPSGTLDTGIKHICIRPTGTMAGATGGTSFTVRFKARIK